MGTFRIKDKFYLNDEPYLAHIKNYYQKLFEYLTPLQITEGGPIILFQVENEYGYYGDDEAYLKSLQEMMIAQGVEVPYVTADGPWGDETHHTSDLNQNIGDLSYILEEGNVNIYMFEGGTNFGFMNGANYYEKLTPDVTSYDYDAVLTENGALTPKYKAFKEVISNHVEIPAVEFSTPIKNIDYGSLKVRAKVSLFSILDDLAKGQVSNQPKSMEKLGQNYGYTLYRSLLKKEKEIEKLKLYKANDRAQVFINERLIGTYYDRELLEEHSWF